jgi:hypothetical protein
MKKRTLTSANGGTKKKRLDNGSASAALGSVASTDNPGVVNDLQPTPRIAPSGLYGIRVSKVGECKYLMEVTDMRSLKAVTSISLKWRVESLDFHCVSGLLVILYFGCGKFSIKAWNVLYESLLYTVHQAHPCDTRSSLNINNSGSKFFTGSETGSAMVVWDAATGTKLCTIADSGLQRCPRFSFDDSVFVSAEANSHEQLIIHTWQAESGTRIMSIDAEGGGRPLVLCSAQTPLCACRTGQRVTV